MIGGSSKCRLKADYEDQVSGEYQCGLSSGSIDGAVRTFGGETLVIFGHDSMDEMDRTNGGGWMRLPDDGNPPARSAGGRLEGEFVNGLGRFVARKKLVARGKKGKARRSLAN